MIKKINKWRLFERTEDPLASATKMGTTDLESHRVGKEYQVLILDQTLSCINFVSYSQNEYQVLILQLTLQSL